MNRVVHFEVHAEQPLRAAEFYRAAFGWEIKEWVIPGVEMLDENRYWMVSTGSGDAPGINGGIMFRRGDAPVEGQAVNSYVCTIGVASLDGAVEDVRAAGGRLVVPRMPIIGVGWLAYCKDCEGNIFGVLQDDPGAG